MDKELKFKSSVEKGFRVSDGDGAERRLSAHVAVVAYCTSEGTKKKFAMVEYWDAVEKKLSTIQVTFDQLHKGSELLKEISSNGFTPPDTKKDRDLLAQFLSKSDPAKRVYLVRNVGWHGSAAFVLPTKTLGPGSFNGYLVKYDYDPERPPKVNFRTRGKLRQWILEVATPASYSSRIVSAVCATLAAIVLSVAREHGEENFGLHFFAPTSLGKSTLLFVARSVAGFAGEGSLHDWNNTDIGFEEIAAASNCSALITDESQMVDSQDKAVVLAARRRAYQFVQGRSKGRSERYQREAHWSGVLLSAGEDSFTKLAALVRNPRKGGEVHRIIDVPAIADQNQPELGIFETVPDGGESSAEAADALREACSKYYGTPLRAFVKRWIAEGSTAVERFQKYKSFFIDKTLDVGLGGVERRFCERFAVMYAAGSLASQWKILPWSRKHIRLSLTKCYRAARAVLNKTLPQPSLLAGVLRKHLKAAIDAKAFGDETVLLQKADNKYPARILVRGHHFQNWFPVIANRDALLTYLEARGLLLRPPSRKSRTIQVRRKGGRLDFYAFDLKLIRAVGTKKTQ